MGEQKFRPAFGPVTWRMLQTPNSVKILFIGQDATHIAEAAGRPATAGFGGRAQDLAAYFGVNEGAGFINTYAYTIKGQYGAFETPYVYRNAENDELRYSNLVENKLWLLSQDIDSPLVKWRNDLIDWLIRNNSKSLKLIVTFGGAARDSIASFVESKGGKVGARNDKVMNQIQIAETTLKYAGGNNEYPVLVNREGKDLYQDFLGRRIDYSKEEDKTLIKESINENFDEYLKSMVFTKGGVMRNGLLHPAQLGGYDLNKIFINDSVTRSLKGLRLNNGKKINHDLLVVELPHPTFLSKLTKDAASIAVREDLKVLTPYVSKGWKISADPDMENKFAKGEPYKYSRANIGPEYYDFGTPGTRMVPVSTASRMGGKPHVIIFGTRERAQFDMTKIETMTKALPHEELSDENLFNMRPRSKDLRFVFDPGPGEKYAKIMKENLDFEVLFKTKEGKSFKSDGINAYYVKTHPEIGDFGHYRGTFKNPKIIILADPIGADDLITARALTGQRGQYLHGLMKSFGVDDQYLVIKTVPFGMDDATNEDWEYVLSATNKYREILIKSVLKSQPTLIVTDGPYAKREMQRILGKKHSKKIISLKRDNSDPVVKSSNIPRSHLSFYARAWEGTSGDMVIGSQDEFKGLAFAEVAPEWAWNQKTFSNNEFLMDDSKVLLKKLKDANLPLPFEDIPDYLRRVEIDPGLSFMDSLLKIFSSAA